MPRARKLEDYQNTPAIHAPDIAAWRKWLENNHAKTQAIWLVIFRKESDTPSVYYSEAVDEALCFGWVDSKPNRRDDQSYHQYFARRRAGHD